MRSDRQGKNNNQLFLHALPIVGSCHRANLFSFQFTCIVAEHFVRSDRLGKNNNQLFLQALPTVGSCHRANYSVFRKICIFVYIICDLIIFL